MTARYDQSDAAGPLSRAALLRAAADGELSDAQRAEVDPTLAEAEWRAIETEAALRQAVGRAMAQPAAPQGLRDRILAAAADGAAGETDGPSGLHSSLYSDLDSGLADPDDPYDAPAPIPMTRWMRGLSLAAAVLLVVAGGFMFMRGADSGGFGGPLGDGMGDGSQGGAQQAGIQLVELRQFISGEHDRCQRDPSRIEKFTKAELTEVPERFRSILGAEVSIEEIIKANLTLRGVGQCRVPGPGSSIHLLLGADLPDDRSATLSLFVQQDGDNRLALKEGVSYDIAPRDPGAASVAIIAWRRDGLLYYLVADPDACRHIREAMGHGGPPSKL